MSPSPELPTTDSDGRRSDQTGVWSDDEAVEMVQRLTPDEARTGGGDLESIVGMVRELGRLGIIEHRWRPARDGSIGSPTTGMVLAEGLAATGATTLAVGVGVAIESVPAALVHFGDREGTQCRAVLGGTSLGCLAVTEAGGTSDLANVATVARRHADGWRVEGTKEYVSLAPAADFALVLCRLEEAAGPLALLVVPRSCWWVERIHDTLGVAGLGTARVTIAGDVGTDAVLGRQGGGLLALSCALTHERLAAAVALLGGAQLAIDLATTHLRQPRPHGPALWDNPALRLRLAQLQAEVQCLRLAAYAVAPELRSPPTFGARAVAAIKATTGRAAAHIVDECAHLFGALGYVEDASVLPRLLRDVRLGRVGGGTDEMMWELVAGGMAGDTEAYDRMVAS